MNASPLRIVVVDDHHAWRQQVKAMLENTGIYQVVGEAADGADAVAAVAALKPDLILLDIELPAVNGIAAATRILAADPAARILFLSGHRSSEIVEAAWLAGALGYVVKNQAGRDLLPAVAAVAAGRRFLSEELGGRRFDPRVDRHAPHVHQAGFYTADPELLSAYATFASKALTAGKTVVALLETARREKLTALLRHQGIDIDLAIARDRYIAIDIDEILRETIVDGLPDETLVWNSAVELLMRAGRNSGDQPPALAAFGEAAQRLWNDGRPAAAVLFEQIWNDASKTLNIDIFCGYMLEALASADEEMRELIGAAHTETVTR